MFDFEKLIVYQKARSLNKDLYLKILKESQLDKDTRSQLTRAAGSIMLNIAEGSGRFTKRDKRHFYITARSSVFECVAILQKIYDLKIITDSMYDMFYDQKEQISKMLYKMISDLE